MTQYFVKKRKQLIRLVSNHRPPSLLCLTGSQEVDSERIGHY